MMEQDVDVAEETELRNVETGAADAAAAAAAAAAAVPTRARPLPDDVTIEDLAARPMKPGPKGAASTQQAYDTAAKKWCPCSSRTPSGTRETRTTSSTPTAHPAMAPSGSSSSFCTPPTPPRAARLEPPLPPLPSPS